MTTRPLADEEAAAWVRLSAVVELLPGVLDTQLRRDAGLTHFEYVVLAMLSQAPGQVLRMSALATQTNSTLPRLSHVVTRLEKRGLLRRTPCPEDGRASNVHLTEAGSQKLVSAAPGHVANVRRYVLDALTPEQLQEVAGIAQAILEKVDPDGSMTAFCRRPAALASAEVSSGS